jgi:hypothetical protein
LPKLKPVSVVARCRGPGWVAIARHYEHEVIGPFKIWTVAAAERGADVIFARKVFDCLQWWHQCDRENANKPKPRRKGKPGGKGKRPPATPRGGDEAA